MRACGNVRLATRAAWARPVLRRGQQLLDDLFWRYLACGSRDRPPHYGGSGDVLSLLHGRQAHVPYPLIGSRIEVELAQPQPGAPSTPPAPPRCGCC